MKKIGFLFTLLILCNYAYSQSALGIKGGVNMSKLTTDAGSLNANFKESLDSKTGYNFGLWGRIGSKKLFLQPELLVATRGGKIDVIPVGQTSPVVYDVKYTNLDLPLLVGYKPLKFLRVMAGPVATFKLSEDKKLKEAIQSYTNNPGEAFANATYGYQIGVGVKVLGAEIDLRKEGSLGEVSSLNLKDNQQFNQKSTGWQLTVAFKIL
jgi:hypothetical protein